MKHFNSALNWDTNTAYVSQDSRQHGQTAHVLFMSALTPRVVVVRLAGDTCAAKRREKGAAVAASGGGHISFMVKLLASFPVLATHCITHMLY